MKRPIFFGFKALSVGIALLWSGCSNEVEVIGEWKEIPIIYGLVNLLEDSVTYIRVEKAFLPPNTSAYEVAKIADSLYYPAQDIDVLLYENDVVVDTLEQVDLNQLGIVKDTGTFASNVNYAYRTFFNFMKSYDVNYNYRIEVHNKVTGNTFAASTKSINWDGNFEITVPSVNLPIDFYTYNVSQQRDEFKSISVNWREAEDAGIYDMRLLVHYAEFEVDVNQTGEPEIAGTRECKTLEWLHTLNFLSIDEPSADGIFRREVEGDKFFEHLAERLSSLSGTNRRRCFTGIDVVVDAAGEDFAEYIKAQNANESLIGGLYPIDPYTNVENGFGIFSTRIRRSKVDYFLDGDNLDYLSTSPQTQHLGFRSTGCSCQ